MQVLAAHCSRDNKHTAKSSQKNKIWQYNFLVAKIYILSCRLQRHLIQHPISSSGQSQKPREKNKDRKKEFLWYKFVQVLCVCLKTRSVQSYASESYAASLPHTKKMQFFYGICLLVFKQSMPILFGVEKISEYLFSGHQLQIYRQFQKPVIHLFLIFRQCFLSFPVLLSPFPDLLVRILKKCQKYFFLVLFITISDFLLAFSIAAKQAFFIKLHATNSQIWFLTDNSSFGPCQFL